MHFITTALCSRYTANSHCYRTLYVTQQSNGNKAVSLYVKHYIFVLGNSWCVQWEIYTIDKAECIYSQTVSLGSFYGQWNYVNVDLSQWWHISKYIIQTIVI